MIKRDSYLNKLKSFKDMQLIKVITGVRRSGKSTLLKMYEEYLLSTQVQNDQIISINLEDKDYETLKDVNNLYDFIKQRLQNGKMNYVFIDEIQECIGFQTAVDSLFLKSNVDIYITGSNAHMLSGELATLLSGRYIEIEVLPLSFSEYLNGIGGAKNLEMQFRDYLRFGGFPFVLNFKGDADQTRTYLDGIYNTIFKKDIIKKNNISNEETLENVIKYAFDNIGNLTSAKKIADTLTSNYCKTTQPTVESYLKALTESFVLYKVGRYDVKGKQYLKSLNKYYVCDLGMRNYLLGYKNIDRGHILENVVFLELCRRGYKVFIGKVGDCEIDFVAFKGTQIIYYQVAESIKDASVFEREMRPLKSVRDYNQRFIITTDYDVNEYYDGIRHLNIFDFLLEENV